MGRIDYIDDPAAPAINSVVPSVVAIVQREDGRILMIHKTDNDKWALPGGGHEPGESISQTVEREVKEETGYDVTVEAITGVYTNRRGQTAVLDRLQGPAGRRRSTDQQREQRGRVVDERGD